MSSLGANTLFTTFHGQAQELADLGLKIADLDDCAKFLSRVNPYRLRGHFRYWQQDPLNGDRRFVSGSDFDTIRRLYLDEQELKYACTQLLRPLEVMFRSRFAHSYTQRVGPTNTFLQGEGFDQPEDENRPPVQYTILHSINRSKEPYIKQFRTGSKIDGYYQAESYADLPIWVAVEAISFGTLSKMIAASVNSGVLGDIAGSLYTSKRALPSQLKSVVYLRNRLAHCGILWNHPVTDMPKISPSIVRRTQRDFREFADHSIYRVFLVLDIMSRRAGIAKNWLETEIEPILNRNQMLAEGIVQPRRVDQMDPVNL